MQKRTVILLRVGITIASLAIVLVLFEWYLRREVSYVVQRELKTSGGIVQQDPEFLVQYSGRGRRFVPNADVTIVNHFISGQKVDVKINSLGFRDDEIPLEKQPGELRVVALGDSITAGDYLPFDQVYVERAESYLKTAFPNRTVRVINTGIGNIGTEEELNILEDSGLALKPDVVVLGYYLNDTRPPWGFAGEIGDRGWWRRHSLLVETIYRNIQEYHWKEEQGEKRFGWIRARDNLQWRTNQSDFKKLVDAAQYDWGAAWQPDAGPILDQQFARLAALSKKHGFKVVLMVFPVSFQIYSDVVDDAPQRDLEQRAKNLGFAFLDLLPLLREQKADEHLFFDQCHPAAKANDLIGKALADFMVIKGIAGQGEK